MIYALTEQQHAQQMAALNHGIRTLNHYDLPLKCEQLHEALAILKGLKPLEPCAYRRYDQNICYEYEDGITSFAFDPKAEPLYALEAK